MKQGPDRLQETIMRLKGKANWRSLVITLSAIVVFVTTYMLILPAITLDKDEAIQQGGIDVAVEQTVEAEDTEAPEVDGAADVSDEAVMTEGLASEQAVQGRSAQTEKTTSDTSEAKLLNTTKELTAHVDESAGFSVSAVVDKADKVPTDVSLQATELTKDTNGFDYDEYYNKALKALKKDDSSVENIKMIRFYDISLESDTQDESVEPSDTVSVKIAYEKGIKVSDAGNIRIVHFGEDKTEVLSAEDNKVETTINDNSWLTGTAFETDGFSEYAVAEVETIEKYVLSSDGQNYHISVTYSADAGIPDGADLMVEEVTEGDPVNGKSYADYVADAENALGWENGAVSFARVFDISIVNNGKKVQPADGKTVDVRIELSDAGKENELNVVHFEDNSNKGDVIKSATDGHAVDFETGSFSAYAIVQGPGTVPSGWSKITSIEELTSITDGVYIGHKDGYYFGNKLIDDGSRVGIAKTKPSQSYPPADKASKYYFEAAEGENKVYAYCYSDDNSKQYVYNGENNSLSFTTDEDNKTAFTVTKNSDGTFKLNNGSWYWNMQGGANGTRFCSYNSTNDANNNLVFWYFSAVTGDPYDLNGKSYGLMNWSGGVAGKALMSNSSAENRLDAKVLTVMSTEDNGSKLFVPNESDISMWKFSWNSEDKYYLTTVVDGSTKYLRIGENGISLVSTPDENCNIQVIPGTGIHAGQISLKAGNTSLTYSGNADNGFSVGGSVGNEWLNLVELSELTEDYFMTYSAQKVSVSDPGITNGSRVIVYTRNWNEEKKKYEYFAIGSDGTLVPVYESGDSIEWTSGQLNKLLWNFVEYYWEGTTDPNYYYELYNQYSEKYIAPQVTEGQILSDDTIGINLNGRRDGKYYSTILAWDDSNYSYVGLKVENGKIVSCPKSEAMDFYFAIMQDLQVDDDLTTVPTVEHTQYGITMKMIDLENNDTINGRMNAFLGSNEGGMGTTLHQGLLSTKLSDDGYPVAKSGSLGGLYAGAQPVNHLFIQSTYNETGYFEYNSTQNYATLINTNDGNFTVYKELGTHDSTKKPTLQHGQFFPYNDLAPGVFASVNKENLYELSSTGNNVDELPDKDPRKHENLYNVENSGKKVDYYFAMELEASFTQTPSGLDAWGHDIIFEFTGDDDFWLYVDNELVIDLGGIHSAAPGSVNFRTGEVNVNGTHTTLKDLFYNNYLNRDNHTAEDAQAYVDSIFVQSEEGNWVFKDYTNHTMRIFYMERGASASNLHMRFNLAAIQKGHVLLNKELSGVDSTEDILAEFPYQIWYKTSEEEGAPEYRLTNALPNNPTQNEDYVFYKDTINAVTYKPSATIGGVEYKDVFFLKPGETADISFPENMTSYRIVECGINTQVYSGVTVNGEPVTGTQVPNAEHREDFGIDYMATDDRAKVNYVNDVNPDALKTLTITKNLFAEDGTTPINYPDDLTPFSFRLYLATENDVLDVANMHIYHVKDPDGYYCSWNAGSQKFEKIGEGISEYSLLTDEQKAAASFNTSIYGQISKIPVDHTVEIRNVLAGTKFRVQERPGEIPDGYSFQKYIYNDVVQQGVSAETGVADTVTTAADPDVKICNLKGWGLRVKKIWRDADYMLSRDATYFALFTKDGNNELVLVEDSVRRLLFSTNPQSVYWYYDHLPVDGTTGVDDYVIREVTVSGSFTTDDNGIVSGYDSVTPIGDGEPLTLNGRQKGEETESEFTYTVQYSEGQTAEGSNVRVDTVTNDRPGIMLKKQNWSGAPLAGAVFTLKDGDSTIGTFTSGADGLITIAFLSNNKEYTLTETTAPQSYHGLESSMTIRVDTDGTVEVSGPDEAYYTLTQAQGTTLATIIIKNRLYTFQAVKIDGDTGAALGNVKFELHKQVTVGGVTNFDVNPMAGYEELVTDQNGVIPRIDNTLPAGTYQLREKKALNGYQHLPAYIEFTVSKTGDISLLPPLSSADWVTLSESAGEDDTLVYTLTIRNYIDASVIIKKVDGSMDPLPGSKFSLYKFGTTWEVVSGYDSIDLTVNTQATLEHLSVGRYLLTEIQSPEGYVILTKDIYFAIGQDGSVTFTDENGGTEGVSYEGTAVLNTDDNIITVINSQGEALPMTGGIGTTIFYILGSMLVVGCGVLLVARRRMSIRK